MPIGIDQIRDTTSRYLAHYPGDAPKLEPLLQALRSGEPITTRKNLAGHVTCGAALIGPDRRILHIRHKALGHWLLPGGHLENNDETLIKAALRELAEETGIPPAATALPGPAGDLPTEIDVHRIPHNPGRQEPEHWHFDFRFVFTTAGHEITLQTSEVSGYRWIPLDEITSRRIAARIAK